MKEIWNQRYATPDYVYGKEPNVFFKEQLSKIAPGLILLPSEGEGRNAVYASKQGWTVAAFDYSIEAQQKAFLLAEEYNAKINYAVLNIENFGCGRPGFDAVALIFAHYEPELRNMFHQKIFNCLFPGGWVILEAYSKKQLLHNTGGPKDEALLYSIDELQNDFKYFKINYIEEVEVELHEGSLHNGKAWVVRMLAQRPV